MQYQEDSVVRLEHVSQHFGARKALDDLNIEIKPGEVLGLLGPNGAGKTTLINILSGLRRPHEGSVIWKNEKLHAPFPARIRKSIGLVPQQTALYGELNVRENIAFAAALYSVPNAKAKIEEVLELVGLTDRSKDKARTLSGGMQRRLALARALVHDPEVLILDEPTLGVDVDARHAIWAHIRLLRRLGKTIVLSSNYLDEAEALCDRIIALRNGIQVASGPPAHLLSRIGHCIDIDCLDEDIAAVRQSIEELEGVDHIETNQLGLIVHLTTSAAPDAIATAVLRTGITQKLRVRPPDMIEVFETLGDLK